MSSEIGVRAIHLNDSRQMKLTGVILDWAGTIVDHGSCAPVAALCEAFASAGVPITTAEARLSMGLAKRAHIASILHQPEVHDRWVQVRGKAPESRDGDEVYAGFVPKQIEVLRNHSELIAGVAQAAARMRSRGWKIGTSTGYNRVMLNYLLDRAREQGFVPDHSVCPDDVPSGRPAPFMCYLNAVQMQVFPMWTLVKIGDTAVDIEEGLNAGMWTIGITRTGNEVGLTPAEWSSMNDTERAGRLAAAERVLRNAGAHYIAESVAECDQIFDAIEDRLRSGGRPSP
jgi:phosphonoacetaldehyde hydrolase